VIQNFISKLSVQEKKIAYITVGFLVLALFDRVFFGPVMSQLKSLDEQIEQEKNMAKRDLRFLSYKSKIVKEDEAFRVFYDQKFQTEEEIIAAFLKSVEVLASEAKLNLIKVSPDDSIAQKGFVEYFANLECNGPLENLAKFMHAIDASAEMLRITKFSVTPKRASEQDVQAAMTVAKMIINPPSADEVGEINQITSQPQGGTESGDTLSENDKDGEGNQGTLKSRVGIKSSVILPKDKKQPEEDDPPKPSIWERLTNRGQTAEQPAE